MTVHMRSEFRLHLTGKKTIVRVMQDGNMRPTIELSIGPDYDRLTRSDAELLASLLIKAAREAGRIGFDPDA